MTDHETSGDVSNKNLAPTKLEDDLAAQLRFQRRWRVLSMCSYVVTTTGTLVCSAGATYYAAGGKSPNIAAILAAIATILVGTEKACYFVRSGNFIC